MKHNKKFLDINYTLIRLFLQNVEPNYIDISYSVNSNTVNIQVVLLEGTIMEESLKKSVIQGLGDYVVEFNLIFISRETYNMNKGEWRPSTYEWLTNVILSKSEI